MDIFGAKTTKNQILGIKLLQKLRLTTLLFTGPSEMCKAAGWGHADISQEFGEGSSDTLLAVDIPIIDYNVCKYKYDTDDEVGKGDFKINEGNICAGSNGKEACIVYKH